jgi:hypothetical protein
MRSDEKHLQSAFDRDGGVILDIEAGAISTLNPTGALVWRRLECGEPIEMIVASLAQASGENVATVAQDVREFVDELTNRNLLPR